MGGGSFILAFKEPMHALYLAVPKTLGVGTQDHDGGTLSRVDLEMGKLVMERESVGRGAFSDLGSLTLEGECVILPWLANV